MLSEYIAKSGDSEVEAACVGCAYRVDGDEGGGSAACVLEC